MEKSLDLLEIHPIIFGENKVSFSILACMNGILFSVENVIMERTFEKLCHFKFTKVLEIAIKYFYPFLHLLLLPFRSMWNISITNECFSLILMLHIWQSKWSLEIVLCSIFKIIIENMVGDYEKAKMHTSTVCWIYFIFFPSICQRPNHQTHINCWVSM